MDIVRISDGLGNQMFQYAFARKWNIMTGHRVYLDTRFINNEDLFAEGGIPSLRGGLHTGNMGFRNLRQRFPQQRKSCFRTVKNCINGLDVI